MLGVVLSTMRATRMLEAASPMLKQSTAKGDAGSWTARAAIPRTGQSLWTMLSVLPAAVHASSAEIKSRRLSTPLGMRTTSVAASARRDAAKALTASSLKVAVGLVLLLGLSTRTPASSKRFTRGPSGTTATRTRSGCDVAGAGGSTSSLRPLTMGALV